MLFKVRRQPDGSIAVRTSWMGIAQALAAQCVRLWSQRPVSAGSLPRPVDASQDDEQPKQDVEEVLRKLNHYTAPRPRASRERGTPPW
jgi:hypothetical protein